VSFFLKSNKDINIELIINDNGVVLINNKIFYQNTKIFLPKEYVYQVRIFGISDYIDFRYDSNERIFFIEGETGE